MFINTYFPTVIWSEEKPEFVKSLNKASNKYISEARKREKVWIKEKVYSNQTSYIKRPSSFCCKLFFNAKASL